MTDGDPIIIGQTNTASNPGNETSLSRNGDTAGTVFVARNVNLGDGIHGEAGTDGKGVSGISTGSSGFGVHGVNNNDGFGVLGVSYRGLGIYGISLLGPTGLEGESALPTGTGVRGISSGSGTGVYGQSAAGWGGYFVGGGYFDGGITVVNGPKTFKIDHPLDPENKYLLHTCVESSEMKNVYDGVAHLDEDGAALVELPEWFEALNEDFRYQLTAVGGSAPDLHVAEEISENRFKIAGGEEGMKACWQVTGTRKDRWAAANRFEVEQEKPQEERGRYLEPSLYDAPEEERVMIGPMAEAVEEQRRKMEELRRRMERHEEPPPEST